MNSFVNYLVSFQTAGEVYFWTYLDSGGKRLFLIPVAELINDVLILKHGCAFEGLLDMTLEALVCRSWEFSAEFGLEKHRSRFGEHLFSLSRRLSRGDDVAFLSLLTTGRIYRNSINFLCVSSNSDAQFIK